MRYSTCKKILHSVLARNPAQAVYLSGPPGVAKTAICFEVAEELGLPKDRVLLFRSSLRDPVDLMGVPQPRDGVTHWTPPAEIARFAEGSGPGLIIVDELAQAVTMMQNALGGLLLDKVIGELRIDPRVMMIATGNRTQDKAGSNRIVSQLANRLLHLEMEANVEDWSHWGLTHGIDPQLIAFLKYRPNLLHDFDPDRFSNATPRTWEMVSRTCDPNLPRGDYAAAVSGLVGDGAAAEYIGFRETVMRMPSIEGILAAPDRAEVPSEPSIMYAVTVALTTRADSENMAAIVQYLNRMPVEFGVMAMKDIVARDRRLSSTKPFVEWAMKNTSVLI